MESGKQYEVIASDGNAMGFFLDGRLYEYLTSTCVGLMDKDGKVSDEEKCLGRVEGDQYVAMDGTTYQIQLKQSQVANH